MHTRRTEAERRIDIARARLEAWTDHQRALELDPGDLEVLAGAIEAASDALCMLQGRTGGRSSAERRLRRALEDVRVAMDRVGRGVSRRRRVERAQTIRTVAGLRLAVRRWRGPMVTRPAITGIEVDPAGRVLLTFCCPGQEHDPDLQVRVRRRVGRTGTYEPIGMAMGATYVDRKPHRTGRVAAYKIELASGPMAGAWSRRAHVDLASRPLPDGWASRHIGRVGARARPPMPVEATAAA